MGMGKRKFKFTFLVPGTKNEEWGMGKGLVPGTKNEEWGMGEGLVPGIRNGEGKI